jgi:hypothetical protein
MALSRSKSHNARPHKLKVPIHLILTFIRKENNNKKEKKPFFLCGTTLVEATRLILII